MRDRLLRSIVGTIDKYGLKKHHLHSEGRLFTFLEHDGVPWNNNPGEHAVKAFVQYREVSDGLMSKEGLSDFLVLLSVHQTCKYRGVSFLKFLLSGEDDVEVYCQRKRSAKCEPDLEVYPEGFPRQYWGKKEIEATKEED